MITRTEVEKRDKAVITSLTKVFGKLLRELRAELLNKQCEFKYLGLFDAKRVYRHGNFITYKGGMWHANRDTQVGELPGDGSDAFTLAVKSGKESA